MITNNKHQIFADEYILTNDAIKSYQKAYPKAQPESARVKSYNLLQDVTISTYIKDKQDKIRLERENSHIEAIKNESKANILQREKALEMVSNVVKIQYNKIVAKDSKANSSDKMAFYAGIERLSKMDGWDEAIKNNLTILKGADDLFIEE
jgi:phage terminase small subunit